MKRRTVLIGLIFTAAVLLAALIFWRLAAQIDNDLGLESLKVDTSPEKQVTLTIFIQREIGANSFMAKWDRIFSQIEKKTHNQLNIKVKAKMADDSYPMTRKMEEGESYDMALLLENTLDGDYFGPLVYKNAVADITTLLPRYAPNFYSSLSAEEVKGVTVDGRIYGVPAKYPSSRRICALVRDDLLNKYGKPEIKDIDDLEAFFKIIKAEEKDIVPAYFASNTIDLFALMHDYVILDRELGIVYRWDDPAMKLMPWEQTPEFLSFCERIDSWVRKGYILKETNFSFIPSMMSSLMSEGKFACLIDSFGLTDKYNFDLSHNGIKDWRLTEHVLYPEKISQMDNPSKACIVFKKGSENIERALMFLEWLHSSQENYDLFMYGIKGTDYTLYGEQVSSGYNYTLWSVRDAFRNEKFERSSIVSPPEFRMFYREKLFAISKYPPHLGFFINWLDIGERKYNIHSSLNHFHLREELQNGKFSRDAVSEYIDFRKAKEIDKLIDEVQRQLDKWMNSKYGG